MGYSVKERAEFVGTFRWIAVQGMETLARWIPITAEMEVKVLFGRHVWEFAQQADALGKRAFELRAPLQFSQPACVAYQAWLRELAALEATSERVSVFYDVFLAALSQRYRRFIATTDALMDEPTVRILEHALADLERMGRERGQLPAPMQHVPSPGHRDVWRAREAAIDDLRELSAAAAA